MNAKTVGYWLTTGLFSFAMLGSGVMNVTQNPEIMSGMAHLGFPEWFPVWLGSWKLAGVAVLLLPGLARLKEWATAGFTIAMLSASAAHFITGDGVGAFAPPLVMLALGLASWALRPASRRLEGSSVEADPSGSPALA